MHARRNAKTAQKALHRKRAQKQADDDYLVFYGDLSAIPLTILSNAPQKLVECRKSRNFGKIMRSTRQVYEPVYAEDDIVGARRPTSTPPSRKKNGAAGNPPAAPFETHHATHEQTPTLVHVGVRSIDMLVAGLKRRERRGLGLGRAHKKGAQALDRHFDIVVKLQVLHGSLTFRRARTALLRFATIVPAADRHTAVYPDMPLCARRILARKTSLKTSNAPRDAKLSPKDRILRVRPSITKMCSPSSWHSFERNRGCTRTVAKNSILWREFCFEA